MTKYAANTRVPADQSRTEIERTLKRWGADQFMYGWRDEGAVLAFRAHNRYVRFVLPLPDRMKYTHTPERGLRRSATAQEATYEQAVRQRWRAMALVIKAKLEAVETGIVDFEAEFLAHILLPDQTAIGDWLRPQLDEAYATGLMPAALPGLAAPDRERIE